ncbi:MAG: hypothetical protein QOD77_324 [Thermoplasmata archaeon]|jgi:uncharacterized membrane protein|nr:hypothetical protein [Thermoplasmata archaeon]
MEAPKPGFGRAFMARWRGTDEWSVFVVGWVLLALLVGQVVAVYLVDPFVGRALLQGMAVDMFAGREGAAGVAIHGHAPPLLVAETSALQHLSTGAIMFPLFLSMLTHYHDRDNFFMRRLRRLEAAAGRHQAFVTRWGPVGVFLFMLVPFLVNGPLVGAIVGRLCGIRTRLLIMPVVLATVASALIWTYANERLQHYAARLGDDFPLYMVVAVIALALLIGVIDEVRERREKRSHEPPQRPPGQG